jgi:hypothetical protein
MMRAASPSFRRMQGSALVFILIIMVVGAAFLVSALKSNPQIERDKITADALAQAKDALIGYAATFADKDVRYVFGHLPCPDIVGYANEGSQAGTCSGKHISAIGRLPWKTLGLPPLRDSSGECLWYAVSGSFKTGTKPDLLNWDSVGQFEIFDAEGTTKIAGTTPENRAVAVIFSAGSALSSQDRTSNGSAPECGGNYTASNYLETANSINNAVVNTVAEAVSQFIAGKKTDTFNDRILFITADEIFAKRIEKRADFPGTYFSDTANLTPTALNDFALDLDTGFIDNVNQSNQYLGGVSGNPRVYGLLQKTAQCLVKYGKNNSTASDKRLPWAAPLNVSSFLYDALDDSVNLRAGRVPFKVDTSAITAPTNPLVTSSNSYRLLTIARCPIGWVNVAGEPTSSTSSDGWWGKWKDHLFYAVADAFKPTSTVATQATPCDSGSCLTVDGIGPYAAVLMFSGKKLASQGRGTLAQKIDASNYLEGANATAIASGGGTAFTKSISATQNDTLICIKQDLSIDMTCNNPGSSNPPTVIEFGGGHIEDFVPAGDTGFLTINDDNSVTMLSGQGTNKSVCFWYPTAQNLAGKTMRAYFSFKITSIDSTNDSKDEGDGLTFSMIPGSAANSVCGSETGNGFAGGNIPAPNVAIEIDTYPTSGVNDPSGNHVAIISNASTTGLTHPAGSTSAACDGTLAGCYVSKVAGQPNWLEDAVKRNMRVELHTGCNDACTSCASGGAKSLVKVWVACTDCSSITDNYSGASSPITTLCTTINPSLLTSAKFGFTAGAGPSRHQDFTIYDFSLGYQ